MNKFGVLNEFSYFPEHVGKSFKLESEGMRSSLQIESLCRIDPILTVLTQIFILTLKLISSKEFL